MKKNYYVTKRLVSLALAVVLSSGSMFATALAATVNVGVSGSVGAANTETDVFYYDAATNQNGGIATVTGFDAARDFISVKLPSGASLTKTDGATGTVIGMSNGGTFANLFTVVGVSSDKIKDKSYDKPVLYSVAGTGTTAVAVEWNATIAITPVINRPDNGTVSYKWTKSLNNGAPSEIAGVTSSSLNIAASTLQSGNYTFTLMADNAAAWTSQTVTVKAHCDAGVAINFGSTPPAVSLATGASTTVQVSATASVTANNCNIPSHAAANHGKTPTVTLSLPTPPPAGATLSGSTLSIGSATLNVVITAKADGATDTTHTIAVTRTAIACNFVTSAVKFTPLPTATPINAEITTTYTLTPTLEGVGGDGCAEHANPFHGRDVRWAVVEKGVTPATVPDGVTTSTSGQNLVLGFSAGKLVKPETIIIVTATADNGKSMTQEYRITRNKKCTMTAVLESGKVTASSPSSGSTIVPSGADAKFTVNTASATLQMIPKLKVDGSCEYLQTSTDCPNKAKHGVNWSIGGTNTAGIAINSTTGVLSVDYTKLTAVETVVTVYASPAASRSAAQTGNVIVRRGTLPSTGGGNNDYDEQNKNSQQWDKLEYRIEDADSKDIIRVSMGDNTDMPARIVRELAGQNVTAEITVTGGYTWIINGKNIKKPPTYQIYMGLGVESVKNKDASNLAKGNAIKILELEHNGTFYGTYTLEQQVDSDYKGKYLYLYKYDEDANKLYYRGSAKVDSDSYVKFPFTSASTYVMTDKALYGEKAGSTVTGSGTTTGGSSSSSGGGATVVTPPASSVAPPPASSTTSSSESSTSSSEASSEIELPSSSSEVSRPTDTEPDEPEEEPAKKSIPLIVPILLVVVTITIVAVILLAKGGMNIGG